MLQDTPQNQTITEQETLHQGYVWDIVKETFTMDTPDGEQEISREFVKHTGAVAIVALNEKDEVFLIKQYRHPVRTKEWEIPAGLLDIKGEDALEAAKRELWEEADLEAKQWNTLIDFYTTPGGNNEAIRIFLARDISEAKEKFERFEEEADMETGWFPLEEVSQAVAEGNLHNPSLCLAMMTLKYRLTQGTLDSLPSATQPFTIHHPFHED